MRIAIIGSTGEIGSALLNHYASIDSNELYSFSRSTSVDVKSGHLKHIQIDYYNQNEIEKAASVASESGPLDLVIIATGILHDDNLMPEKSLRDISFEKFETLFRINTALPAIVAKYFVPKLNKRSKSIFAALSARVGSISDNRLGGWYAYRASKTALNMILKNISIEASRSNKNAIIVGLHPGTVDSPLSKPFQANVAEGKLFTPKFSAESLSNVIQDLDIADSGRCFAWDGQIIEP